MVGEPALVELGLLLARLRRGALALGLLLGDPCALLGNLRLTLTVSRFLTMRGNDLIAALIQPRAHGL